jgi:hypothetical protein
MEVSMTKTTRRTLQFESLEGKTLLSSGMANPAAAVHQYRTPRLQLNGTLYGIPSGSSGPEGYVVSSFPISGHIASMGNVTGSLYLTYNIVGKGQMPNLSSASLVLANQAGSVDISLNAFGSSQHKYTIMSGSGIYTYASGKGTLTLSPGHHSHNYVIKLRS